MNLTLALVHIHGTSDAVLHTEARYYLVPGVPFGSMVLLQLAVGKALRGNEKQLLLLLYSRLTFCCIPPAVHLLGRSHTVDFTSVYSTP